MHANPSPGVVYQYKIAAPHCMYKAVGGVVDVLRTAIAVPICVVFLPPTLL